MKAKLESLKTKIDNVLNRQHFHVIDLISDFKEFKADVESILQSESYFRNKISLAIDETELSINKRISNIIGMLKEGEFEWCDAQISTLQTDTHVMKKLKAILDEYDRLSA